MWVVDSGVPQSNVDSPCDPDGAVTGLNCDCNINILIAAKQNVFCTSLSRDRTAQDSNNGVRGVDGPVPGQTCVFLLDGVK